MDSVKAFKILHKQGKISKNCVLMVEEIYLQKATQYHSGEYVGADENGNLYKGIVAFMTVGLKESIPYVVQAIPEVTFDGEWLANKMASCNDNLTAVVTDNHASNVNAFSKVVTMFISDPTHYIQHPLNSSKNTYLFFDTAHIVKNIRNNLLNGKKFVFPEFIYNDGLHININCLVGYIRWKDLRDIYDLDKELKGHLRIIYYYYYYY